jgi:hypothetical protein
LRGIALPHILEILEIAQAILSQVVEKGGTGKKKSSCDRMNGSRKRVNSIHPDNQREEDEFGTIGYHQPSWLCHK